MIRRSTPKAIMFGGPWADADPDEMDRRFARMRHKPDNAGAKEEQ